MPSVARRPVQSPSKQKGVSERFEQILVPTEEVVEVKRGAKFSSERISTSSRHQFERSQRAQQRAAPQRSRPRADSLQNQRKRRGRGRAEHRREARLVLKQA